MTQPVGGESQQTLMLTWDKNNNQESLYYIGNSESNSVGRAIIVAPDNKIIIVGSSTLQPYAIKIDSLGNVVWEQVYDNYPLLNWLTDIIPVPNEAAFYVYGTVGYNAFMSDLLVAKISDATGEMLWDTIYDFGTTFWDEDGKDVSGRLIRSKIGGYIAGSALNGFANNYYKGSVIKFNNDFTIDWYNDQLFDDCGAATINELPNGDIITSGCNDPLGEYAQMQIIKLSGVDGGLKWRRTYGGSWHDYAYDLALMPDGGFLVAGRQDTIIPGAPVGHASAWLLKLNCMGLLTEPEAAFTYEPQGGNEIQFTNQTLYVYPDSIDGGYYRWDWGDGSPPYLCGQGYDPCSGNILTHQYPASGTYTATLTAIVCSDTSIVQAQIDTEGAGGTVGLPPDPLKGEKTMLVYPNPATNTLTFQRASKSPSGGWGVEGDLGVKLLTLTGQTVLQTTLGAGETHKTFSVAHLPEGVYLYSVEQSGSVLARGKVAVVGK
ncbi:MAG: T9SS type A sorting domain-containing protein [Sphingobacteriales bacterium]|nr:MAG: T9SS type A sorting domain-containing protein [Sphingobacteriales bacterium]